MALDDQELIIVPEKNWHNIEEDLVLDDFRSNRDGLSNSEVIRRLQEYGSNEISAKSEISMFKIFLEQFKNYLVIILLGAATISILLNHIIDGIAIYIIVLFAVILGFSQEYKADKAIEVLKEVTAPDARVIRSGKTLRIPAKDVVPGDILTLDIGDKIAADSRLLSTFNLTVDEASLTGEFVPVQKTAKAIANTSVVADRINMVFAGTVVTEGRGTAIIVRTGMNTEFGKISKQLESIERVVTPLQKQIDSLGKRLTIFSFIIIFIVFVIGLIQGEDPVKMFVWSVSLAVAVVPEALPAIITISLAIGVQKMSKKNALVRKLPAVETLGSTSIICSDKTGTITEGKMQVKEFILGVNKVDPETIINTDHMNMMIQGSNLCNNVTKNDDEYLGNATEIGIKKFIEKINHPLEENIRVDEVGFTSKRKMMSTINKIGEKYYIFSKGALETILDKSVSIMIDGVIIPLNDNYRYDLQDIVMKMGQDALRSIAVAYKPTTYPIDRKEIENDLIILGIYGLSDPPKANVKETILECNNVGIRTIMITGDHLKTANAIAKEVGILRDDGLSISGVELDQLSDEQLSEKIENLDVVARVSPSHKLRLVKAIQSKGHIVAMTGDGINDAPALKAADVGIAMGSGTAVSKEASDMILSDDGFDTIVEAIKEGRLIYDNIKKYLMFLLSSNLGEILLLSIAIFAGMGMPLLAIHILYINLASDGLPAIALAFDPPTDKKLKSKPRDPNDSIFSKPVIKLLVLGGIASAIINISLFLFALNVLMYSIEKAQIIVFINLVLIQFLKAYSYRSDSQSILYYKPFSNKWLNIAIIWELILLMVIIYNDKMQIVFQTFDLNVSHWMIIIISAFTILPILEFGKWFFVRSKL